MCVCCTMSDCAMNGRLGCNIILEAIALRKCCQQSDNSLPLMGHVYEAENSNCMKIAKYTSSRSETCLTIINGGQSIRNRTNLPNLNVHMWPNYTDSCMFRTQPKLLLTICRKWADSTSFCPHLTDDILKLQLVIHSFWIVWPRHAFPSIFKPPCSENRFLYIHTYIGKFPNIAYWPVVL